MCDPVHLTPGGRGRVCPESGGFLFSHRPHRFALNKGRPESRWLHGFSPDKGLLPQPDGFEGFLFRPVLPALHDQSIALLVDEDVRIANASAAGAFLPAQHRV